MKHLLGADATTPMGMALLVWVCTLPLVLILILPFFGWQIASLTAVGLLAAALILCWTICANPRLY